MPMKIMYDKLCINKTAVTHTVKEQNREFNKLKLAFTFLLKDNSYFKMFTFLKMGLVYPTSFCLLDTVVL